MVRSHMHGYRVRDIRLCLHEYFAVTVSASDSRNDTDQQFVEATFERHVTPRILRMTRNLHLDGGPKMWLRGAANGHLDTGSKAQLAGRPLSSATIHVLQCHFPWWATYSACIR